MSWTLVIVLAMTTGSHNGGTSTSTDAIPGFSSEAACEAAKKKIEAEVAEIRTVTGSMDSKLICIEME